MLLLFSKITKAINNPKLACRWFFSKTRNFFNIFKLQILLFFSTTTVKIGRGLTASQKIRFLGRGEIIIGERCLFGVRNGGGFWDSCCELQARYSDSKIIIGNDVLCNNNLKIVATFRVEIHEMTLIGANVQIFDSDFHDINPVKRRTSCGSQAPVIIGQNVWIGTNVTILKGSIIGDNTIVGACSVVTGKNYPPNVIIAGNPARIIKQIGPTAQGLNE